MTFTRRRFLHTLVVSASALSLTGLTACSSDDNEQQPIPTNNTDPAITPQPGPQFFPQSVMSGDPRPDSVILWTRGVDGDDDLSLILQVSESPDFEQLLVDEAFDVSAEHGHCLKVRVTDLAADQHYYYRFLYQQGDSWYHSNLGRTKTAPAVDADRPVKFGFASCQDFAGRYYNTYLSMLAQDDLDFVLHLGDYIYETVGDSGFQDESDERRIQFRDQAGAIALGDPERPYYAASSLDNYRQLYETYRSDPILQQLHERFPLVAIWDDHEFSDDSWQANGTYLDGSTSELNAERKRRAEQAYFEFMPIDHLQAHGDSSAGQMTVSEEQLFPNTKIYRELRFGQHLHLALTDYRTFRPDHLIAEDAFPAAVALDQTTLTAFLTATGMASEAVAGVLAQMSPVIDIDAAEMAPYKAAFTEIFTDLYTQELINWLNLEPAESASQAAIRASAAVQGKLTSSYLNQVLAAVQASLPSGHPLLALPALPEQTGETGLAYYTMGKTTLFSDLGARYLVVKPTFDLFAGFMEWQAQQQGQSVQSAYDQQQLAWLTGVLSQSDASHKVMASSVSFAPLLADLSPSRPDSGVAELEAILDSDLVPSALKQQFYLNVDHWDGLPQYKQSLVQQLLAPTGTITLAGDIHANLVSTHALDPNSGNGSVDFTTSSVSSGTFGSFLDQGLTGLLSQLGDVPEEASMLKYFFDTIAVNSSKAPGQTSQLQFARMWEHGVGIATVSADKFEVAFHNVPTIWDGVDNIRTSFYDEPNRYLNKVRVHRMVWQDNALTVLPD
ncbi:alkaline phosphatase D family protein [Ferrimonas senticii]|uniref:alkaline phosphatase D family protein n=1 Tax=Ferrimonas senticii TaxID=394566 RepID=UPI000688E7AF|nr:alkaline phosphatase D family protein [Ferrimonas senticii]